MARFRTVDVRIWIDHKFGQLSDDGQLAFLFLLTHPDMTALGAMRGTWAGLAAERGWTLARWTRAIAPAVASGMVEVNAQAAYVGLPNFLRYNAPAGPNSVKIAWSSALDLIPECPERRRLAQRCLAYLERRSPGFRANLQTTLKVFQDAIRDAMRDGIEDGMSDGKSDASPIQEQEQELLRTTSLSLEKIKTKRSTSPTSSAHPIPGKRNRVLSVGASHQNPKRTGVSPFSPQDLVALWNRIVRTSEVRKLTEKRARKARRRLADHPDPGWWQAVFERVRDTPFLRAENPRGWRVTLDWLLANDTNAVKVSEGAYDGRVLGDAGASPDLTTYRDRPEGGGSA
jgi:hypothetical protein